MDILISSLIGILTEIDAVRAVRYIRYHVLNLILMRNGLA